MTIQSETSGCDCRRCLRDRDEKIETGLGISIPVELTRMVLCGKCGNKRCPHANDHRHDCTQSNAAGQPGSAY